MSETRKVFSTCSKSPPLSPPVPEQFVVSDTSKCLADWSHQASLLSHQKGYGSIFTLAGGILAGASSVAALPMSVQYTMHLLGFTVVTLISLQRAKPKLPEGSRQRNHWQPCHTPSASLHNDRW